MQERKQEVTKVVSLGNIKQKLYQVYQAPLCADDTTLLSNKSTTRSAVYCYYVLNRLSSVIAEALTDCHRYIVCAGRYSAKRMRIISPQLMTQLQIRGGIDIIVSLFFHQNICCGYLLEALQQGSSNEYQTYVFVEK